MRTLSSTAKTELNKRAGGDCWLWIVELSHASMTTLRYTENTQNVSFGGYTYTPMPMALQLPDDTGDGLPNGSLVIDNVNKEVYNAIVGLTGVVCKIGLVLGNQQGTTELAGGSLVQYKVTGYHADATTLMLALSLDMPYDEPFPGDCFSPDHFPKLFIEGTS